MPARAGTQSSADGPFSSKLENRPYPPPVPASWHRDAASGIHYATWPSPWALPGPKDAVRRREDHWHDLRLLARRRSQFRTRRLPSPLGGEGRRNRSAVSRPTHKGWTRLAKESPVSPLPGAARRHLCFHGSIPPKRRVRNCLASSVARAVRALHGRPGPTEVGPVPNMAKCTAFQGRARCRTAIVLFPSQSRAAGLLLL